MNIDDLQPGGIAVLGIPFDKNSSFLQGPALAPPRIREALLSPATNLCTENHIDLGQRSDWCILDDMPLSDNQTAFGAIEHAIRDLLTRGLRIITLGGDHSITYPIIRAFTKEHKELSILQLDAHPDLYDDLEGNPYSHACPFARIMEEKLASRLVQAGIRTMTDHQRKQAERFGVEVIEMQDMRLVQGLSFEGSVYISLDMDCLDPAFAPGVSHYEPGGLSTREVLTMIQGLKGNLVGADIVEFNPDRDPLGITGTVAAKFLKEILGRMLSDTI
jgi:agmatinase